MRKLYFFICALFLSTYVSAQHDCSDGRFYNFDHFQDVDVTTAVEFGSGPAVGNSQTEILEMDIYEPQGDTHAVRPLIILAFGGSFIAGQRQDVAPLCEEFAKMGYVAATIDYRVGFFFPNEVTTTKAVMRGMHDMKAAVRYFYMDAQNGNQYKIDTNYIIVGGVSAGAICGIHTAYMTEDADIPQYLLNDTAGLGGVEGLSGNPGYSSTVHGVISFSGTIGDSAWIDADEAPIVSLHELGDQVVPYGTQEVAVGGFPTGLVADGSGSMKIRTDNIGLPHSHKQYPGNGHVAYLQGSQQEQDEAIAFVQQFIGDLVCGSATLSVEAPSFADHFEVYPNPVRDRLVIKTNFNNQLNYELMDVTGRTIRSMQSVDNTVSFERNGLKSGIYVLRITDGEEYFVRKLIFR